MFNLLSNIEWIFDGVGSTIIGTILGLISGAVVGGFVGYKIAIKNKIKQKQKARDNVSQQQIGSINNIKNGEIIQDERKSNGAKS